ncbi:hypothetical protein T459_30504 [Capsicum annuum]|uniref:Uncharacterized protein n=1 Tax=Capsicum annuum TaxID=4072 RepID=A0A2G2Y8S2_CAPAN|nr:hypothetical protein T459_30504 [Capsicum annuum]
MEPQQSKGKAKAGPSTLARKRSRPSEGQLTRVPRASPILRVQVQKFGFKAIRKDGKQWYTKHTDAKYISEVYINHASLMREYPSMVRRIEALNMNFIFYQPTECNLHLVREFYANWDPSHPEYLLKAYTQVGRSFGFGGLVTRFLRRHKVNEEELDYKPETKTDEVLGRLYGLMMMMTRTGDRPATLEELHAVELDYPLGHHARTIYRDFDMESDEEEQSDDDRADDDGDDADVAPEDMAPIVPFE